MTDGEPSPIDEVGALQGIGTLRENAWRKAKRLVAARTSLERRLVSQAIEAEAAAFALSIVGAARFRATARYATPTAPRPTREI